SFTSRGDIYILDMGKPIKIVEMAHDLIRLCGLVPDEQVKIVYTGVRPGEKLHEQLYYDAEVLEETPNPKIKRVRNTESPQWDWLQCQLESLLELCEKEQPDKARVLLMELATGKLAAHTQGAVRS
ncbi:MAG: polysaccharide biosynthesis protein, partial [Fimbriimonadales bacterium]